ncbi:hypothetical protein CRYUN_Cryun22dG0125300 [Craigia yunnanensis]
MKLQFGWCGNTPEYYANGCQSQCSGGGSTPTPTPSGGNGVASIISRALFDEMLKYRNDGRCPSNGFYTYDAFIDAARSFNGFGTSGHLTTRKREVAAFLAQTSHETTDFIPVRIIFIKLTETYRLIILSTRGWPAAPDGPYAWGYCFIRERGNPGAYCSSTDWPCPPGRQYYGRGPIQLTHNYKYGQAGRALRADLIINPDLVATNPSISFRTAVWFWMTPQGNKPSSHNVIIGQWTPSDADRAAGRLPGYGVITNIIYGGLECGRGPNNKVADRIGFNRRCCDLLGVSYGSNLDCNNQRPFT